MSVMSGRNPSQMLGQRRRSCGNTRPTSSVGKKDNSINTPQQTGYTGPVFALMLGQRRNCVLNVQNQLKLWS